MMTFSGDESHNEQADTSTIRLVMSFSHITSTIQNGQIFLKQSKFRIRLRDEAGFLSSKAHSQKENADV